MFPRGGSLIRPASAGASEEKKAVAGGESLFKIAGDHKVKKKKQDKKRESFGGVGGSKKRKSREADSDDVEKKSTRANSLQLKTLEPGTQILGVVTKVSKRNATVSLPCGLNGFVGIEHLSDQHEASSDQVSDSVADYLSVGDMVRCAVVEVERLEHNKRRLLLSLAASAMNSQETIRLVKEGSYVYGNVQSVEDHGYVVSLGSDSCTGFLSFKVGGGSFDTPALKIGQVVEAIVSSVVEEGKKGKKTGGKRVLQLDSTRSKVDEFVVESCPKLDALQAGFLVKAKKREYLEDGLAMTFCGFYNGTVDMFHLDDWKLDPKMRRENRKKPRQGTLMARVLFVNFKTKEIGLTLVPNLVNRGKDAVERTIASCKRVGHVIDECAVERIDQHKGVLLSVKLDDDENKMEDDSELFAYAKRSTISKGSEDPEEIVQLNKKYKVGQIVPAKVLGFAAIDNVFNVSLAQSVIDASVLHYDELKPGMKVKGKIAKIMDKGMFVSLSDNVQGFIHANQLSDVAISDPSSRFNVGETLNLRVLVVQFEGNRPKIYLTNKRSIVTSSLPPITSFDEAIPGSVAQGYVDHTSKANGVIVKFFNNVRGQVSGSELESMGVDNPQETYPVGKVVKVRVISCSPLKQRMQLSFRTASANAGVSNGLGPGSLVSGKIISKTKTDLTIRLDRGFGAENTNEEPEEGTPVKKKRKKEKRIHVTIPSVHLSDSTAYGKSLLKKSYKEGSSVENIMLLISQGDDTLIGTLKPALLAANRKRFLPSKFEDVHENATLVGYASKVIKEGVEVSFLNKFKGFVPRANVSDDWVDDPRDFITLGQTVCVFVNNVDVDSRKVTLSMKNSALDVNKPLLEGYVTSLVEDKRKLAPVEFIQKVQSSKLSIGDILEGEITKVLEEGVEIMCENGLVAFCELKHVAPGKQTGDKIEARVLDIDFEEKYLDVSMETSLLESAKKKKKLLANGNFKGTVHLVKENYVVLSLGNTSTLCVAPVTLYNGRLINLEVGMQCDIRVVDPSFMGSRAALGEISITHKKSTQRRRSGSQLSSDLNVSLKLGALVQGVVKDITACGMSIRLKGVACDSDIPGSNSLYAYVNVSNIADESTVKSSMASGESVLGAYSVGDAVEGIVTSIESKKGKNLRSDNVVHVGLSLRECDKQSKQVKELEFDDIIVGKKYTGYIQDFYNGNLNVVLSRHVKVQVFSTLVSKDLTLLDDLFNEHKHDRLKKFVPVEVEVIRIQPARSIIYGSMLS